MRHFMDVEAFFFLKWVYLEGVMLAMCLILFRRLARNCVSRSVWVPRVTMTSGLALRWYRSL